MCVLLTHKLQTLKHIFVVVEFIPLWYVILKTEIPISLVLSTHATCFSHADHHQALNMWYTYRHTHTHMYVCFILNQYDWNIQDMLTGLRKLVEVDSNMYVNCNLQHWDHNYMLYLDHTLHQVYAVISKYADNLSIIHTSKQPISRPSMHQLSAGIYHDY